MPVETFVDACLAGDLAAHIRGLADPELRDLSRYARWQCEQNPVKGGIPELVRWACILESAKRHDSKP